MELLSTRMRVCVFACVDDWMVELYKQKWPTQIRNRLK